MRSNVAESESAFEMNRDEPSAPNSPGRPRSETAREAILTEFLKQVAHIGYPSVTIDAVAKAAGVGRMTIYRWYPSKAAIALDAALFMASAAPKPETGSLTGDLMAILKPTVKAMVNQGALFAGLMAEAQTDPIVGSAFKDKFVEVRRSVLRSVFLDAQTRGELLANADVELLIDFTFGPIWYRLLNKHAPLDGSFTTSLIHAVIATAKTQTHKANEPTKQHTRKN
jgi:AcrR family transcriptional regulator